MTNCSLKHIRLPEQAPDMEARTHWRTSREALCRIGKPWLAVSVHSTAPDGLTLEMLFSQDLTRSYNVVWCVWETDPLRAGCKPLAR